MTQRVIVLIPARMKSTRFPHKPLANLLGKSLIQRVWESLHSSEVKVVIVTDHEAIEKEVLSFGGNVVRVNDETVSGTERIYLAYQRFFKKESFDFIVNVQGDSPLVGKDLVKELVLYHQKSFFDVTTLGVVKGLQNEEDQKAWQDPNKVKIVATSSGKCQYFSRSSVPHIRDQKEVTDDFQWLHHQGVYCFRPKALEAFCRAPEGEWEHWEKLEQLRALELGLSIGVLKIQKQIAEVDTPEDLALVEEILRGQDG